MILKQIIVIILIIAVFFAGFSLSKFLYDKPVVSQEAIISTKIDTLYIERYITTKPQIITQYAVITEVDTVNYVPNHIANLDTIIVHDRASANLKIRYDTKPKRFDICSTITYPIDSIFVNKEIIKEVYIDKKTKTFIPLIGAGANIKDGNVKYSAFVGVGIKNKIDIAIGLDNKSNMVVNAFYRFP